ncbi:MAG: DNA alkylation repair protein [Planctomycetes bacterium]|nr:DNA alkylation repair protein [Planctomycetota bacterium]
MAKRSGAKSRISATEKLPSVAAEVKRIVAELRSKADPRIVRQMQEQFGITLARGDAAFGMRVGELQKMAAAIRKSRGRDHALALALWESGYYECRMLAAFVDDPALVTVSQMNRWCKDFDNWGICDTVCFHLFDKVDFDLTRTRINAWAASKHEFVKRTAFALLASIALHRKDAPKEMLREGLELIEEHASDERNFVKKGISWALRGIGKRKGGEFHAQARAVAARLTERDEPAARWIGKDALRDLGESRR